MNKCIQKITTLLPLLLLTTTPAHAYVQRVEQNVPGQFDYYVLNLSWQPQFCATGRNGRLPECDKGGKGFVVHGLWPQFTQGYPEYCSTTPGPRNPEKYLDVMPGKWLVQHEWKAHGTCSGLSPDEYYQVVRKAFNAITIPPRFTEGAGGTLTPAQVKQAFVIANPGLKPQHMAVGCGNNNLTALSFCLTKDTLSPKACSGLRDCRANSIRVNGIR